MKVAAEVHWWTAFWSCKGPKNLASPGSDWNASQNHR